MFKRIFILLFRLVIEPEKMWIELSEKQEGNNEDFYKSYLYPVFGMIALLSFVGVFVSFESFNFQIALKAVIKQMIIYFGGFYFASYVFTDFVIVKFTEKKDKFLCERFVGYSSALVYMVAMILSLFPGLFFLLLLILYSVYIIWHGIVHYIKIKEENWMKSTIYSSIVILLSPILIGFLIDFLLPGMKI
jgi:hypothetical protein